MLVRTCFRSLAANCRQLSARQMSLAVPQEGVFELRNYNVAPSQMGAFLALTKEQFHLRTAHSRLLGYWTGELGALAQVTHLWHYETLSARAGVRAALTQDEEWLRAYLAPAMPMLLSQENSVLQRLPAAPVTDLSLPGTYELETLTFSCPRSQWEPALKHLLSENAPVVAGAWKSVIGPRNTAQVLLRFDTVDDALEYDFDLDSLMPMMRGWYSKVMLPFALPN